MIYFLYGPDTYRSREKLNEIIREYKKTHTSGLSFHRLDTEEDGFENFKKIIETASLFPEKKLIIITSTSESDLFQKQFKEFLEARPLEKEKDVIVIFRQAEKGKKSGLTAWLPRVAKTQEFRELKGVARKRWASEYLENKKARIDSDALALFLNLSAFRDTWGLKNELDKLVSYSGGDITENHVATHLKKDIDTNIFEMIDALSSRQKKHAMRLLGEMMEKGANESYLLSMIAYRIKNLIRVKALDEERVPFTLFSKRLPIHPYVIRKSYDQSKRFTLGELKKIYRMIATIDLDSKSGKREPRLALELFVARISHNG